ncbi:MAG: hypothetical protein Q8N53_24120 [Longimicrobiales bacterium]|nr:hypothetical protein [Longimicrobiales bacterium]
MARSVGLEATVSYAPPMTREERRSLHLHRAIADRLRANPDGVLSTARGNLEGMRSGASPVSQPLREWGVLLDRPMEALAEVLTDPSPWARELRHVTPFAGVLTAAERAKAYRTCSSSGARRCVLPWRVISLKRRHTPRGRRGGHGCASGLVPS